MSWLSEHRLVLIVVLMGLGALFSVGGAVWLAIDSSKKSEKIASLNEQIAGSVTGGDSWCCLFPFYLETDNIRFYLKHNGKYPLYDVSIQIIDYTQYLALSAEFYRKNPPPFPNKTLTKEEYKEFQSDISIRERAEWSDLRYEMDQSFLERATLKRENLGTITKWENREIYKCKLPLNTDSQTLSIIFNARNGSFRQTFWFIKPKKYWKITSEIYKHDSDGKEVLLGKYETRTFRSNEKGIMVDVTE